jgi:hypothetical protein
VRVREEASTSFWEDSWLPDGPLVELLPAFHSHGIRTELSVRPVLQDSIDIHLQPRLTRTCAAERGKLDELLSTVALSDGDDIRLSLLMNAKGQLKIARLYRTLMSATSPTPCPFVRFMWKNRAPPGPILHLAPSAGQDPEPTQPATEARHRSGGVRAMPPR